VIRLLAVVVDKSDHPSLPLRFAHGPKVGFDNTGELVSKAPNQRASLV